MRWSPALSFLFFATVLFAIVIADAAEADLERRDLLPAIQASASPTEPGGSQPSQSPTDEPSSSDSSSDKPSPTPTEEPTPSSSSSEPSNSAPPTTEAPTTDSPSETPTPTDNSSSGKPSKTNAPSPSKPSTTSYAVVTQSITVSDGSVQQTTFSSPVPEATNSPGLNQGDNSGSSSSGLSTQNRNIIIGVVVGVGGAIILGGVAFVMWRLRRKRNARGPSDEDDLMNAGTAVGSSSHETSSRGGPSPFKSTLDQYHNPGPVNPSSNF